MTTEETAINNLCKELWGVVPSDALWDMYEDGLTLEEINHEVWKHFDRMELA